MSNVELVNVYAIYLDLDRGDQLQGVLLNLEDAKRHCKGNPYLSYRAREAIKIDDKYVFVESTTELLTEPPFEFGFEVRQEGDYISLGKHRLSDDCHGQYQVIGSLSGDTLNVNKITHCGVRNSGDIDHKPFVSKHHDQLKAFALKIKNNKMNAELAKERNKDMNEPPFKFAFEVNYGEKNLRLSNEKLTDGLHEQYQVTGTLSGDPLADDYLKVDKITFCGWREGGDYYPSDRDAFVKKHKSQLEEFALKIKNNKTS